MAILRDKNGRFAKGNKGFWLGKKRPNISGKNNPKWKGGKIKYRCLMCGKVFKDYRTKRGRKFCSYSCRAKYYFSKEKNPNWKGGITKNREHLKHSECYKKWRLKVFQRDRFTCQLCGYRSKKSKAHGDERSDIEAHHIIPVLENPKLSLKVGNGITLCRKCHLKTYGKEKNFEEIFKKILFLRFSKNPSTTIRRTLRKE